MNIKDAAKILGLRGDVTPDDVLLAYRKAAFKYHPDRNESPEASNEMMAAVNAAYKALKDFTGCLDVAETTANYGDELNAAIAAALAIVADSGNTVKIELMGCWLWVTGNTKPYAAKLNRKTGAGFYFAPKKQAWYFRPDEERSFSRGALSLDEIRDKYGSQTPRSKVRFLEGAA